MLTKSFRPSRKLKHRKRFQPLKKLRGERNYFRIRIGDYRLGLKIEGQLVTLVRIINRKEIYRYFP